MQRLSIDGARFVLTRSVPWRSPSCPLSPELIAQMQFGGGDSARSRLCSGIAAGRPPVGQRPGEFLQNFLTFLGHPAPVFRCHLHSLRHAFLIGPKRFRKGTGCRQLGGQLGPQNLLPTSRDQARHGWLVHRLREVPFARRALPRLVPVPSRTVSPVGSSCRPWRLPPNCSNVAHFSLKVIGVDQSTLLRTILLSKGAKHDE